MTPGRTTRYAKICFFSNYSDCSIITDCEF
jgi:hypothetical protein